jgi:putative hydrolase of the HAD superfamily
MTPEFIYFDLGKVLVDFSVDRMCRQMGDAAGVDPDRVRDAIFVGGLQVQYETGRLSTAEFIGEFCRQTGSRPDRDALARACNDIFWPNYSMLPVVSQLAAAGHRLGILSNTCEGHWRHCYSRFTFLRECFSVHALSYEIGVMKPDAAIFCRAAELAGVSPERIFYTDDIAGHVDGARSAGFDAVVYTSTAELVAEIRRRGLRFNL